MSELAVGLGSDTVYAGKSASRAAGPAEMAAAAGIDHWRGEPGPMVSTFRRGLSNDRKWDGPAASPAALAFDGGDDEEKQP